MFIVVLHSSSSPLSSLFLLPSFHLQVWFQNRRMKDKRQRHSLPWPHPFLDPLGALVMGRASSSSILPYPFIPPQLPLHHFSPLAISVPASAQSHHSAPMRTVDAFHLSQYHSRPGGLPPMTRALYPSASIMLHPASCPSPVCLRWGPEQLLKARGESVGRSQLYSPKTNIQPAALDRREEVV